MLGCKKLDVILKNQAHNKINCIHVLIFQVNFIINLVVRAISDMLEHLLYVSNILIKTGAYFPVHIP